MSADYSAETHRRASVHAALADPGRLAIVDRLLLSDATPSELRVLLGMPSNLLAHHLGVLETAGVLRRSRSEGDRRRTYLSIAHEALETLLPSPVHNARRVVFVCTQNSARSQLAAAVWHRHHSPLGATSAGTHPASAVHRDALAAARRRGLSLHARAPQHLDDVREPGDLIVAVCDNAHEELPTDLPRIHWSIPDPTRTPEPQVFDHTIEVLTERINRLVSLVGPSSNGADQ
ncbi:helix-turn-helix domain-containing protein [Mycolicibacterium hippocampi]|uniref:Putative regulatory protein, ArsR family n=1 Tax=Mycolicibacterium hippocampi TaxID=659824 RepID=A0A7I9ZX46_9MYCO|nr:helix-turn-helix domain-containing protein [Mycolicibacterium hippocampi]GFH05208.1 putative regulatory protein, ArsR family [Mycolicibacterium hippocampi]